MKMLAMLGVFSVAVVIFFVGLILFDKSELMDRTPSQIVPDAQRENLNSGTANQKSNDRLGSDKSGTDILADQQRKNESDQGVLAENEAIHFGLEFEKKWAEDREKIGKEHHQEMEKLWFEGRRPRGQQESIDKLEKLLQDFPDTNRAGCAAWELGHHYIRKRDLDIETQRKKAEKYWRMAQERYPDSICEYNSSPSAMSKMALVNWVLRYTDPSQARRMLQDLIENYGNQTDHLGQSLAVTAQRLLDQLDSPSR